MSVRGKRRWAWLAASVLALLAATSARATIVVGSKNFTESYLLAEILTQWLRASGIDAEHRRGLGGTKICFDALRAGDIDLYPEYSGTIERVILDATPGTDIDAALAARGLRAVAPLGFNNSYALALNRPVARARGITRISDLAGQADLRIALSHEFRARGDGWPALTAHYGLQLDSEGIEHGLAYRALADGAIDVTDAYTTDGELARYDLVLLDDDRRFFPRYEAAWLTRSDLPEAVNDALAALAGRIDAARMQQLNAAVALEQQDIAAVAAGFLASEGLTANTDTGRRALWRTLAANTWRHVQLAGGALLAAAAIGVGLALLTQPHPRLAAGLLYVCGLMQTIPSIALLALMIPLFGIGVLPALIALFLYALLPIVRATLTALNAIEPTYLTVADALGMSANERRRYVLVPLAMPHILAGLRTATVISIGTATLAAFIGAGGLGQPIVTGLALNDSKLILQGAVPAAVLAIVTDFAFDALERRLVPAHLRQH